MKSLLFSKRPSGEIFMNKALVKKESIKKMLFAVAILTSTNLLAQHALEKIWQTDLTLKFPEAVVFEPEAKFLYVSILDGNPLENDGKGAIGKIGLDGKIIDHEWVTGLDAPKGLGLYKNILFMLTS
jgi:hypothetical protein